MKFQLQSYFYFSDAEQISVLGGEDDAGISGGNDGEIAGMDSDDTPADYGEDADDDNDGDYGDDEDDDGSHVHYGGGKDWPSSQVRSRARGKAKARGGVQGRGRAGGRACDRSRSRDRGQGRGQGRSHAGPNTAEVSWKSYNDPDVGNALLEHKDPISWYLGSWG